MKGRIKKDITIRYIPNLLSDENRRLFSFPYNRTYTIRYYLKKSGVYFDGMRITVNGNEIKNLRQHLQSGDEIVVVPNIEFEAIFAFFELGAFWVGVGVALDILVTVLSIAYTVYSALAYKPRKSSFDTIGDGTDEGSPSASWTGVRTMREPGGSVPIIYGRRLTGGTVINEYITTDGDKNYLNSLVAIGEGKFRSIVLKRINRNDATNYNLGLSQDGYIKSDIDLIRLINTVHSYTGVDLGAGELSIDDDNDSHQGTGTLEAEGKPITVTATCISQHIFAVPRNITQLKYRLYAHSRDSFNGSNHVEVRLEYTADGTNWSTVPGTSYSNTLSQDSGGSQQGYDTGIITLAVSLTGCKGIRAYIYCNAYDNDGHVDAYGYIYGLSAYGTPITGDILASGAIETRLGTNNQTVIPHFEDLHDIHSLSVPLTKNNSYVYTTQSSDVEAFELRFNLPSGLFQQDSGGSISSWDVTYKIEYRLHPTPPDDPPYIDLGNTTISAKSRSEVRRIFRKEGLIAGKYDIKMTRISDNSSLEPMKNGDLYLVSVDEINMDDLEYPNTGLAGIRALATEQLSGDSPEYEFEAERVVLCPKVMNGEVEADWEDYYWDPTYNSNVGAFRLLSDDTVLSWDGITYVERFSANPIWCLYDLMTKTRYGIGNYITTDDHDLDYLLEMSQYCEEKVPDGEGGYEKRFRMDICIDSPQKALELIMQLSTIFRGLPFYSDNGKIRIAIDKPDTPVQLFGMGNIVEDSFSQTWSSKRDIPNIVYVQYDNEDNYYQQEVISVVDEESLAAGKPINKKEVRYYGTKLSYAIRYGRNLIKAAKYIDQTINIKAGIGALVRQCGEVIDIAHDVPQWGFSGSVKADSTTTKVKLDREVVIEDTKSYAIRVDFAQPNEDGSPRYEERTVPAETPPGAYMEIEVSEAFSLAPQEFDVYSFGEVDKVVFPARIMSLRRQRMGEVEIEAQEYNEDIYDDSAVVIPERKISALELDIPNVTNLELTERISRLADGTIEDVIDVWFRKPALATYLLKRYDKAKIYLSDNNGQSWLLKGETATEHFQIIGDIKDLQAYKVAVVSVSVDGEEKIISNSPQASITVIGKSAPPSDIAYFDVEQLEDELIFGWLPVFDVDLKGYELRMGASWDTAAIIDTIFVGTKYRLPIFAPGINIFWLKAIDRSGNYSQNAISTSIFITRRPGMNAVYVNYEWGRLNTPDEMWLSENIQRNWDNLHDPNYNHIVLFGKTINRWKTDEIDWAMMEAGEYDMDAPVAYGAENPYIIQIKIIDFGAVFNVNHLANVSIKTTEGVVFIMEDRTSVDGINWTDYHLYMPGFITARYWQLRAIVLLLLNVPALGTSFKNHYYWSISLFDMPDIKYTMKDIDIAEEGSNIIFDRSFIIIPTIIASAMKSGGALIPVMNPASISQVGITGVKLRDEITGNYVSGKLSLYLEGY